MEHQMTLANEDVRSTESAKAPGWASWELAKLPVLSIRQPWAWMIVHAGKDIENRTWKTNFRGRFLIHAAKGCTYDEWSEAESWAVGVCGIGEDRCPTLDKIERGGIVGVATLVDCVTVKRSRWFCGPFGFVLDEVQPLDFLPCKGALGFFRLPM
jgi:hypothetical protein